MFRFSSTPVVGILLLLLSACSKDLPESFKAIPASTKLVATLDAPAAIAMIEQAAGRLAPDKAKEHAEQIKMLNRQLMSLLGIDMKKLKTVLIMGDPEQPERSAVLIEGLGIQGLPGKSEGEHLGLPIKGLGLGLVATELPALGLVIASGQDGLRGIIDTFKGKAKRLIDTDEGKTIGRMLETDKDLDLMRVYLLGVKLPETGFLPMKFHSAGLFIHADRGAVAALLSDEPGAKDLASVLRKGISSMQMIMAFGGSSALGDDSPIPLDKATQDTLTRLLAKLETSRDKDLVKVSCRADLKPLLAKATELGMEKLQAELPAAPADADSPPAAAP